MSRIGNQPITIPSGVTLSQQGTEYLVEGPKGKLPVPVPEAITVSIADQTATIARRSQSKPTKALHGTTRAHMANAIHGVTAGWTKELELVGVGYRAAAGGNELTLTVGYSHPVKMTAPEGIEFNVVENKIHVSGIDKQLVGDTAAKIRKVRPPEPYKGKGIRYVGEVVRRKAGKSAKAAGAAA